MTDMVKLLDRNSAVETIRKLGEDDLIYQNRLIVERLKLISQAKSTSLMSDLNIGDKVISTGPDGRQRTGRISQLNKKTTPVLTDDGQGWKVSPGLLERVGHGG